MDRIQLEKQAQLEKLLMKSPLPCRIINRKVKNYIHRYEEDEKDEKDIWLSGFQLRYNQHIHLERKGPFNPYR